MSVRGERAGARGLPGAAPHRRGHDLAHPYRGEDRAELPRRRRPRARRLARGGRGGQPAQPRDAGGVRPGRPDRLQEDPRGARGPRPDRAAGQADAGARQPAHDRLGNGESARALRAGRSHARRLSAGRAGGPDRLDAVLPDLGAGGTLPRHPGGPEGGAGGAEPLPGRPRDARSDRARAAADGARGVRAVPGRRAWATTSRCTRQPTGTSRWPRSTPSGSRWPSRPGAPTSRWPTSWPRATAASLDSRGRVRGDHGHRPRRARAGVRGPA